MLYFEPYFSYDLKKTSQTMNFITQISVSVNFLFFTVFSDFIISFLCFTGLLVLSIHNIKCFITHTYYFTHYTIYTIYLIHRNPFFLRVITQRLCVRLFKNKIQINFI